MDQKPSGTAYLDDIVITAHPTTGAMTKVTVAALLAASTNRPGADVTPPTVVSATVENANPNQVVVVFSESVTVTTAGWSFRRNGSNWAITSVSGSGTTWTFLMATSAAAGETLDRSYNSATGATVDGSANELASFTNSSVTNNVSAGAENITWSQLTQTTNSGGGTITGNSATTPAGGTATKKITKANGNYVQYVIGSTVSDSEAVVLAIDNNNDAVYLWGTSSPPNDVVALATAYHASGDFYASQDSNSAGTNLGGTPATGDVVRLEISGNDVLYKVNGTTIHTYTGALTGYTDLFVKAVFAVNSTAKKLETCTGLGLVTI